MPHRPNVPGLSRKLISLCGVAEISQGKFVGDIENGVPFPDNRYRRIDRRTTRRWLDPQDCPDSIPQSSCDVIIQYWNSFYGIPVTSSDLEVSFEIFENRLSSWKESRPATPDASRIAEAIQQVPVAEVRQVELPDAPFPLGPLANISDKEKLYICGKYKSYKLSFTGTQKITVEFFIIRQMPNVPERCTATLYCHPAHIDNWEDENELEIFEGILFKFGNMYYIIASYDDGEDDQRIRFIQLPTFNARARRQHYGIVTGPSANLEEPVASRFIAKKIGRSSSADIDMTPDEIKEIRRVDINDREIERYVRELLLQDPNIDGAGQWLMTTSRVKMTREILTRTASAATVSDSAGTPGGENG